MFYLPGCTARKFKNIIKSIIYIYHESSFGKKRFNPCCGMFTKTYSFHLLQNYVVMYCVKCFLNVNKYHSSQLTTIKAFLIILVQIKQNKSTELFFFKPKLTHLHKTLYYLIVNDFFQMLLKLVKVKKMVGSLRLQIYFPLEFRFRL